MTERGTGVVRFFNDTKGYGFCTREGGLPDVFIHVTALYNDGKRLDIRTGDKIEFDVVDVEGKGPKAANVRMVERVS